MRSGRYGRSGIPGQRPGAAGGKPAGYERAAISEDDRRCEPRPKVSLLFDPAKRSAAGGLADLKQRISGSSSVIVGRKSTSNIASKTTAVISDAMSLRAVGPLIHQRSRRKRGKQRDDSFTFFPAPLIMNLACRDRTFWVGRSVPALPVDSAANESSKVKQASLRVPKPDHRQVYPCHVRLDKSPF